MNYFLHFRRPYGQNQCPCINGGSCWTDQSTTWFSTCSGGVIHGTGYVREIVNGQLKMRLADLSGLVNSEKMILKFSDTTYELYKV